MIPSILCAIYVVYLYQKLNREQTLQEIAPYDGTEAAPETGSAPLGKLIARLKALEERLLKLDVENQS